MRRIGIFTGLEVNGDRMEVRWADPVALPRLTISGSAIAWSDQRQAQSGWRGSALTRRTAHPAVAARLGHAVASLRQRVQSAERIAAEPAKLAAWRSAIR